jgi:DNA-binding response OmpR family regulator
MAAGLFLFLSPAGGRQFSRKFHTSFTLSLLTNHSLDVILRVEQAFGRREDMALILIVDDDEDIVATLKNSLTQDGYQVVCASNGNEALESFRIRRPNLVLLDIAMPGMDGIEICRQLRADRLTAAIPIFFITVSGDIESKTAAFDAGADDYLVKPFDLRELDLRIKALLIREKLGSFSTAG